MDAAEKRLHTIIVGVLVPVMLVGVVKLSPILTRFSKLGFLAAILGSAVASAVFYKLLVASLNIVVRNIEFVKRRILGRAYLNGTWIGYYDGPGGTKRHVVEFIEQSLTSLVVRGESFDAADKQRGLWTSRATLVDTKVGILVYTCSANFESVGSTNETVVTFSFGRADSSSPPHALSGFVIDGQDGTRTPLHEKKLAAKLLDVTQALKEARRTFP